MFEHLTIANLTPPVLLGIAILMLLTGRLIPRVHYKDKMEEAEKWRLAYEAEREARAESDAQTRELLELARTTEAYLGAIYQRSTKIESGDI